MLQTNVIVWADFSVSLERRSSSSVTALQMLAFLGENEKLQLLSTISEAIFSDRPNINSGKADQICSPKSSQGLPE